MRDEITNLRITIAQEAREDRTRVFRIEPSAAAHTVSLRPGVDLDGREDITLSVAGLSDVGVERIRRSVHTAFEPDVDRDLAVMLATDCLDVVCTLATTCAAGACGSIEVASAETCP